MVEEPGFSPEEDVVSVALEVAGSSVALEVTGSSVVLEVVGSSVALEVIGIDRVPVAEESGCTLEEG